MGLSEKQQKMLRFLVQEKAGGMTVDQFSKLLEISRSAIHQHIAVLERDGYVTERLPLRKLEGGREPSL